MKTIIFYYTGTGNSLWIAKKTAEKLENCELYSMTKTTQNELEKIEFDSVGFIFPVYIWGVPAPILNFIKSINKFSPKYCFAIAVNGGQVANTLIQLGKFLKTQDVKLNSGFEIKTPSNYIPWGGPCPENKQKKLFNNALVKIEKITSIISNQITQPVEKGPLWQRVIFTWMYKISFNHVHSMDNKFWVDDKCNGCKICEQICPSNNILMVNNRPVWNQKCHQCLACIQWCPQEAIQYGKKTQNYKRYHHPEINLKEIL